MKGSIEGLKRAKDEAYEAFMEADRVSKEAYQAAVEACPESVEACSLSVSYEAYEAALARAVEAHKARARARAAWLEARSALGIAESLRAKGYETALFGFLEGLKTYGKKGEA